MAENSTKNQHLIFIFKQYFNIIKFLNQKKKKIEWQSRQKMINSYYRMAADELNIEFRVTGRGIMHFRKDGKARNVWRGNTDLDGGATLMIAGDKPLCYQFLKEENIPVPRHAVLKGGDYRGALEFKESIDGPVVIKPARGTADAAGVFVNLTDKFDIWWAVHIASARSRDVLKGGDVLIEEYFEGTNYRLFICDGKFCAASSRIPGYVIADGVNSVGQLIAEENKRRIPAGKYYEFNELQRPIRHKIAVNRKAKKVLKDQGYSLKFVPKKGTKVYFQNVCDWLYGGEYYDVTSLISPDLVDVCQKAVTKIGIKLAGVDLIAKDIESASNGSFVINEVNTTPDIWVNYEMVNQDQLRFVANDVLKAMFGLD